MRKSQHRKINFATCIAVAAPLLAALPAPAHAQKQSFIAYGAGGLPCSQWNANKDSGPLAHMQDQQWLWGFISGFNNYALAADADAAGGMDASGMAAWMDNYCAFHPSELIASGAQALAKELQERSGTR